MLRNHGSNWTSEWQLIPRKACLWAASPTAMGFPAEPAPASAALLCSSFLLSEISHSHLLQASCTIALFLLFSLWAEFEWVWERSCIFSTSLHFPSELGGLSLPPQILISVFYKFSVLRSPCPSFLSTREAELSTTHCP